MKTSADNVVRLLPAAEPALAPAPGAVALATVVAREGEAYRVRIGRGELLAGRDPSVDPALLEEVMASGARVVLEGDTIVGCLAVARSLVVDRQGAVEARVTRMEVTAEESAMLRTRHSFLKLEGPNVEIYGTEILTRARELTRFLARMIKLN